MNQTGAKVGIEGAGAAPLELTFKAVLIGIVLAILFAAANMYLALKAGTTVASAIPAVVIAMGLLKAFKHSSKLESNIAQTIASSADVAPAIAFVLPALVMVGYWTHFHYLETVAVGLIGGLLGVLMTVPLRKSLMADKDLPFPEAVAISQMINVSDSEESKSFKHLMWGSVWGGFIALAQIGFKVFAQQVSFWGTFGRSLIGVSLGFNAALLAAGFIVGIRVAVTLLVGAVIGWFVGVPVITFFDGLPHAATPTLMSFQVWQHQIRYIGVGTMLVGGLWTIGRLGKPIFQSIVASFKSIREATPLHSVRVRMDDELPFNRVLFYLGLIMVALLLLCFLELLESNIDMNLYTEIVLSVVGFVCVCLMGFMASGIGAYFSGLLGSTNSPTSGLVITAILFFSVIVTLFIGQHPPEHEVLQSMGLTLLFATLVACSTIMAVDHMQSLKVGQFVNGTPRQQQKALMFGIVIVALVSPIFMVLLFNAYGIGGVRPHPGMSLQQVLPAPQATIMSAVVQGFFKHQLPWSMVFVGVIVACVIIVIDRWLAARGSRWNLPVLGVGLGVYLPLDVTTVIVLGGVVSYIAERALIRRHGKSADESFVHNAREQGILTASGIVAGASLMGVILAVPFTLAHSSTILQLVPDTFEPYGVALGFMAVVGLCVWLYRVTVQYEG